LERREEGMRKVNVPLNDGTQREVICWSVNEYLSNGLIETIRTFQKKKGWSEDGKPIYYLNVPIAFDIETSHYDIDNDSKQRVSWMYIWQCSINGEVIMGRTWGDFHRLLSGLKRQLKLYDHRKAIIFIHNFAYEYQFMYSQFRMQDVFARDKRKVIKANMDGYLDCFEIRCTFAMSNTSLAQVAKETTSCNLKKMKGDLDYDKLRTKRTILTDEEMVYCVNDVLIIDFYVKELLKNESSGCIANIPITATGFVRRDARNTFGRDKKYREFYKRQQIDAHQFVMYHYAYRGGDTHAQGLWCREVIDNVYSYDLTSSYPYRIVAEEFPLSSAITIEEPTINHLNWLDKNKYLYIIDVTLCDIKWKGLGNQTYIPVSKCLVKKGFTQENGRIVNADEIRIVVTSLDFEIMQRYYDFGIVEINNLCYHLKKGLLPEAMRNYVLNLYKKKTTLKDVEGSEVEYYLSKTRINAVYGMCVTNPLNDEILFEEETAEWKKRELPITYQNEGQIGVELEKAYRSRNNFLPYTVGVWVSAYARYDLHNALTPLKTDSIYWDTDSCKFINKENMSLFERLNKEKENYLLSLNYSLDTIAPKDINGNRHVIGLWDNEYPDGVTFMTYGAKKYFYRDNKTLENHITVSGLNKSEACKYLTLLTGGHIEIKKNGKEVFVGGDIFEPLHPGFEFPAENSGRTYAIYSGQNYFPKGFEVEVNGEMVSEKSFVSIVPTSYTLNDTDEHEKFTYLCNQMVIERRDNNEEQNQVCA